MTSDPRLVSVGGIPMGLAVAVEGRADGRIVYEVEPIGVWADLPPFPRQEITEETHGGTR